MSRKMLKIRVVIPEQIQEFKIPATTLVVELDDHILKHLSIDRILINPDGKKGVDNEPSNLR
jgi:hypothetical protein